MPNHVDNCLTATGRPERIEGLRLWLRGKNPRTGDEPMSRGHRNDNHTSQEKWEKLPDSVICFHKIIPLPARYSQVPYGDGGRRAGIDLEVEAWGMKWGPYTIAEPIADPGVITYRFRTAWEAPHAKIFPALCQQWQDLFFTLSWGGEGPTRGRVAGWGNAHVGGEDDYNEYKKGYPPYDEGDEDESYRRRRLIDHAHRITHLRHVAEGQCLRRDGFAFDEGTPDGVLADYVEEHFGWASHAERLRRPGHWYEEKESE